MKTRTLCKALERVKELQFMLILVFVLVFGGKYLLSVGMVNLANRELIAAVVFNSQEGNLAEGPIPDMAEIALSLSPTTVQAYHTLGRVNLWNGDEAKATKSLASVVLLDPENEVAWLELGDAYDMLGMSNEAVQAYKQVLFSLRVKEAVANYCNLVDRALEAQDWSTATANLRSALALDPGNLYALYYLWLLVRENHISEPGLEEGLRHRLEFYSLEGVMPREERTRARALEIMPELVRKGIWELTDAINVGSLYLWYGDFDDAEMIFQGLKNSGIDSPQVHYYLAEISRARGDLDTTQQELERSLDEQSDNANVYFTLGQIAERRLRVDEAIGYYQECLDLSSKHWLCALSLLRLTHSERDAERLPLVNIVAQSLGLDPEQVRLGPNLLAGLPTERVVSSLHEMPLQEPEGEAYWEWSPDSAEGSSVYREKYQSAFYLGGIRQFDWIDNDASGLRIQGFWREEDESRSRADGNIRCRVRLRPSGLYVLSFTYRTEGSSEQASVFFSWDEARLFKRNKRLPNTDGNWYKFVLVGQNCAPCNDITFFALRLWSKGMVEFHDIELRELFTATLVDLDEPVVVIPGWK